ncbi:spore germination protein [Pseudoneobacillus sp. C159]
MFKKRAKLAEKNQTSGGKNIQEVFTRAKKSSDFFSFSPLENVPIKISFYSTVIESALLHQLVISPIQENSTHIQNIKDIKNVIPVEKKQITNDASEVEVKLTKGYAVIQFKETDTDCLLVKLLDSNLGRRPNNDTENEFSVIGPKVGFVEDLGVNLHLLRQKLNSTNLLFEEIKVGNETVTSIIIAYLDGMTNPEYVKTARQRIQSIDIDVLMDNTRLEEHISDNSTSPFPMLVSTERVDRVVDSLLTGNLAIISEGSPYVLLGPANLMNFFSAGEDYYLSWMQGSFFRLIRIMGVIFSIFATSIYVAILTYHYEIIPNDLLGPIIFSRANVPFPPVIEVLFLELTIELLREGGSRLPTKIGQTLGIVGGIVIGQATVDAALTSNILLIIVALSALASFTTPIYKMSITVRMLRFLFILLAAIWGGFGLAIGVILLLGHLMRLKSLGAPYMVPLYPLRKHGLSDTFIRPSYAVKNIRPSFLRTLGIKKYSSQQHQDREKNLDTE